MKYYLDTAIWIDIIEDRKGYCGEPLGEYGIRLISRIFSNRDVLVMSDVNIRELSKTYPEIYRTIDAMYHVETVISTKEQFDEAKEVSRKFGVPPNDALHAIIARDNSCTLITRDRHFDKLRHISEYYLPEEFFSA